MVCFGGAGPVHAVKLAQELNIPKLIVPEGPGVNCALGLLMADFRHDYSQTFLHLLRTLDPLRLTQGFRVLEEKALEQMIHEGVPEKDVVLLRRLDLRYLGQGYELEVPAPNKNYEKGDLEALARELGRVHHEKYGYSMSPDTAEIVNLRLTAIGGLTKPEIKEESYAGKDPGAALKERRRIYMDGRFIETPIYERKRLKCGNEIKSPAIIEQLDSTTVLFEGYNATVDRYRNLIIEREREI